MLSLCCTLALFFAAAPQSTPDVEWGQWQILGPFDHPKGYADVTPSHKPEKQLKLMKPGEPWEGLTETYKGSDKIELGWKPLGDASKHDPKKIDVGLVNFLTALPSVAANAELSKNAAVYLYRQVKAKEPISVAIQFGSDDGVRLWFNGEDLVTKSVGRGVNPAEENTTLHLYPGSNHILVKVVNGDGGWGFQMQKPHRATQKEVNAAIEKGVNYLLSRQLIDGSWDFSQGAYRNGTTSLIVYTLVKSGVSPRHPAVLEALAFLAESPTVKTYSAGCHLMALDALASEDYLPWMEELLGDLISWQDRHGVWAYPENEPDLSCTQFAALGLRAAANRGLEIPDTVWLKLAEGVLDHQLKKKKVDQPVSPFEKYSGSFNIAGFSYKSRNPKTATGSMTGAGIATLEICKQALGNRLPDGLRSKIDRQVNYGLNWVIKNYSMTSNPRRGAAHLHYYLYGIERVGSIMNLDTFGKHDWYWDGATFLVKNQNVENGYWPDPWGRTEAASCFALLFLERATRAAITDPHGKSKKSVVKSDPAGGPLHFSAMSGSPASFWVNGKDASMSSQTIHSVEYHVRQPEGEWRIVSIADAPENPSPHERYAGRYTFEEPGTWDVKAVAICDDDQPFISAILKLEITDALPGNISSYPRDAARNLIPRNQPKVRASSGGGPQSLVDNRFYSRWVSKADDVAPEFTIELKRAVKADRLLFSHARTRPIEQKNNPRVKQVHIWIDKEVDPIVLDIDTEYRKKTVLRFEETRNVRRIRVKIVATEGGELGKCSVGFTEVELQGPRRRRGS
ncbi:MAG: terpene cyclase/mutase family protein [Planctomycetes bacterium]|nr:terpene cyclase/mutase family protein [Planctomycetota bacterium]